MTRPSRRTVLCSTAAVIGLSAGCLADNEAPSGDADPDDPDEGSPTNETDGDDGPGDEIEDIPAELADAWTLAFQTPERTTEPDITVLRDADRATDWLDERSALRDTEGVADFVDETDFETSILVSLAVETPTPCYEVVLESIGVETSASSTSDEQSTDEDSDSDAEEQLVLEAAVGETDAEACAQSITTVGRLVRVTFEAEPLATVSATLTGHDGTTYGVTMGHDSASASASKTVDSDEGSGSDSQSTDS